MSRRFAAFTAFASALTFGGVWVATAPPEGSTSIAAPAKAALSIADAGVFYTGCNKVRAAGMAPLNKGQPGYRAEMDGDGDGIACEDYGGAGGSTSWSGRRRR